MLFNADHANEIPFNLPHLQSGEPWEWLFDTSVLKEHGKPQLSSAYALKPCSVAVLRSPVSKQSLEVEEKPEEVLEKTPVEKAGGYDQRAIYFLSHNFLSDPLGI